jgi:hypothetical protein
LALQERHKLLLTATPLQNSLLELFGLASIIDEHAATCGGKPWKYALIPHDAIAENMTLAGLVAQFAVSKKILET